MMPDDNTLEHIGTKFYSGRYPYGSGKNPGQRSTSFRQQVLELKKAGLTEKQIATGFGMKTSSDLRARISIEKSNERRQAAQTAIKLKEKGYSNVKIGEMMGGISEGLVRNYLNPSYLEKASLNSTAIDMLKKQVGKSKYLDVGVGVEAELGITRTRLKTAIKELEASGEYKIHYTNFEQLGTGKKTSMMVLTKADVTGSEVHANKHLIRSVDTWSDDGGRSFLGVVPIKNISSSRVKVRFAEDGGTDRDGLIELRRGVDELSLGDRHYAQVRIGVDGTHYMKGMAVYSDKLPDGTDILFNTNKSSTVGRLGALKPQKTDKDNPFGSSIRQKYYIDADGKKQLSALNMVGSATKPGSGEEGSWSKWSKSLSSQFLSKQSPALAKQQLDLGLKAREKEYSEIMALTNPAVRAKLLSSFADECDSRAVHLKAAALPRQSNKVLIPLPSLKENEAYSTTYNNGDKLALIRHPHGGIFEIGVVTVNNKNREGKRILDKAEDSLGIHPKMAHKLSGADFDGDTVLAIPYTRKIQTSDSLKALKDFDPSAAYPKHPGMKVISSKNKQTEMGKISNLITDMTIKGAPPSELARAVRHSMVVIDAEKHELNYRQSYTDNGIAALKVKYQGGTIAHPKGASTLLSKSSSTVRVGTRRAVKKEDLKAHPELKGVVRGNGYSIDPRTGKKIYVYKTEDSYVTPKGKTVRRQIKSTRMFETEDAHSLSSGTIIEKVYGDYANSMKELGNKARLSVINTPRQKYSRSANKAYHPEVESLKSKLRIATANKPRERQAQLLANKVVAAKKASTPGMDAATVKKVKAQALESARLRTHAKKDHIQITPSEWNAIQSGAVSHNVVTQILNNAKPEHIKALATPRTHKVMSTSKVTKAQNLLRNGYTQAEVSRSLGVSVTALAEAMKGE